MDQRGSVTVLMAAVAALTAFVALALVEGGVRAVDAAKARTAADAAVLAGVAEGRVGATDLARRNGGQLAAYEVLDGDVLVSVRVGRETARARARAVTSAAPRARRLGD